MNNRCKTEGSMPTVPALHAFASSEQGKGMADAMDSLNLGLN